MVLEVCARGGGGVCEWYWRYGCECGGGCGCMSSGCGRVCLLGWGCSLGHLKVTFFKASIQR